MPGVCEFLRADNGHALALVRANRPGLRDPSARLFLPGYNPHLANRIRACHALATVALLFGVVMKRCGRKWSGYAGRGGRIFAWFLERVGRRHDSFLADHKRRLFADLAGTILEIGPGTGANLPFYPGNIRWIGIEPNTHMHEYLRRRAAALDISIDLRCGIAEQIDIAPESVDAVISTLVLCSVDDLPGVLTEIHRVLKPGGRFVFLEHVGAPHGTWLRRLQRWVKPAWRILGAGCQPDRDIEPALRGAGFIRVDIDHFRIPSPVISPHVAGIAFKA
jgi:SAM-dependent methyltransferase